MASVRVALVTQARAAARALGSMSDEQLAVTPAVESLVRRAQLCPDAVHTLDWAFATLCAHAEAGVDETACRLLRAARARVAGPAGTDPTAATGRRFAWL